jgi:prophage regulatory protein
MAMREQGESLLPLPAVKARVGMGKTKIYEEIKAGAFPKSIKNGRNSVWVESEIDCWVKGKIQAARSS